jgi:hypothetical protein
MDLGELSGRRRCSSTFETSTSTTQDNAKRRIGPHGIYHPMAAARWRAR